MGISSHLLAFFSHYAPPPIFRHFCATCRGCTYNFHCDLMMIPHFSPIFPHFPRSFPFFPSFPFSKASSGTPGLRIRVFRSIVHTVVGRNTPSLGGCIQLASSCAGFCRSLLWHRPHALPIRPIPAIRPLHCTALLRRTQCTQCGVKAGKAHKEPSPMRVVGHMYCGARVLLWRGAVTRKTQ